MTQNPFSDASRQAHPAYGANSNNGVYQSDSATLSGAPDFDGATQPDQYDRPLYGASFKHAVKRFFKNYVTFTGRASRSEFWYAQLLLALLGAPLSIAYVFLVVGAAVTSAATMDGTVNGGLLMGAIIANVFIIATGLLYLILLPAVLALGWRRLHDANLSGLFYLLTLVPFISLLVFIVVGVLDPKPEGRRYDLSA